MTEHTHSRAKPTNAELDKTRARLAGKTQPNASGATADILPSSDDSLAARVKAPELSPEDQAIIDANRARRKAARDAAIAAQRAAADKVKPAPGKVASDTAPPDPVNGEQSEEDEDEVMEEFTANMTEEEKEQFKRDWAGQGEASSDAPAGSDTPAKDALLD